MQQEAAAPSSSASASALPGDVGASSLGEAAAAPLGGASLEAGKAAQIAQSSQPATAVYAGAFTQIAQSSQHDAMAYAGAASSSSHGFAGGGAAAAASRQLVEAAEDTGEPPSQAFEEDGEAAPRMVARTQSDIRSVADARQWALELAEMGTPLNPRARWCVNCNKIQRDGVSHRTIKKDHVCLLINPDLPPPPKIEEVHPRRYQSTEPYLNLPATSTYSTRTPRLGGTERTMRPASSTAIVSRAEIARYPIPIVPVEQSRREASAEEHILMPRILRAAEVFLAALGKTQATCNNYINHLKRLYIRDGWCPDYMATDEYRATIFRDPVNKAHSQYPCSALKLFQQFWIQRCELGDLPEEDRPAYQVDRPMYGPTGDMPRLRWSRSRAVGSGLPSAQDEIRRAEQLLEEVQNPEGTGGLPPHAKRQRITELSPEEIEAEEAAQAAQSQGDAAQLAAQRAAQQLAAAKFAAAQAARVNAAQLVVQDTDAVVFRRGGAYAGQAYSAPCSAGALLPSGNELPPEFAGNPGGTVHKLDHINKIREAARALWAYRRGEGPAPVTAAAMLAAKKRIDRAKVKESWADSRKRKLDDIQSSKERREQHLTKKKETKLLQLEDRKVKAQDVLEKKVDAAKKKEADKILKREDRQKVGVTKTVAQQRTSVSVQKKKELAKARAQAKARAIAEANRDLAERKKLALEKRVADKLKAEAARIKAIANKRVKTPMRAPVKPPSSRAKATVKAPPKAKAKSKPLSATRGAAQAKAKAKLRRDAIRKWSS